MMRNLENKEVIRIGSMFCGMGGIDQGLKILGFESAWALDIMREATESFKANHPQANVYCKDAHTISDFSTLSEHPIKGLVFGPPCQGFSRANSNRSMSDPRNYAYLATLRAIETTNVEFFIFENVIGLLDMVFEDGKSVFEKIKSDYEQIGSGYTVTHQVIDTATVGVPQANRLRLIMVGFRKDLGKKYDFSPLTHGPGLKPFLTQKDTIWHLKDVDQSDQTYSGDYDWKFLSRKRQKNWDEPAYTIEASSRYAKIHPGNGKMKWVSENNWVIPKECRRLSVLESKLLQTFPSDYVICGDLDHQYTQIGNAVPPKLAEYIGNPIAKYYESAASKKVPEEQWLIDKLQIEPSNSFYRSLLNWISSGKELTEKQRKYINL